VQVCSALVPSATDHRRCRQACHRPNRRRRPLPHRRSAAPGRSTDNHRTHFPQLYPSHQVSVLPTRSAHSPPCSLRTPPCLFVAAACSARHGCSPSPQVPSTQGSLAALHPTPPLVACRRYWLDLARSCAVAVSSIPSLAASSSPPWPLAGRSTRMRRQWVRPPLHILLAAHEMI